MKQFHWCENTILEPDKNVNVVLHICYEVDVAYNPRVRGIIHEDRSINSLSVEFRGDKKRYDLPTFSSAKYFVENN